MGMPKNSAEARKFVLIFATYPYAVFGLILSAFCFAEVWKKVQCGWKVSSCAKNTRYACTLEKACRL